MPPLQELMSFFEAVSAARTELVAMGVQIKTTKCVMHLQKKDEAFFLPRWNAMTDAEKLQFRKFIGSDLLRLTVPAQLVVDVREGTERVVVFYIHNLLEALVDGKHSGFYSGAAADRMRDAIDALHSPAFQHLRFLKVAYGPPPPRTACDVSVPAQLARLHSFSL